MTLLRAVALLVFLLPQLALAQPRIGLLWLSSDVTAQNVAALNNGLKAQGLAEGRNYRFEPRNEVRDYPLLEQAAKDLVQAKVDVILAWGDTATRAARAATTTIPIVLVGATDPADSGLVATLGRPGGNLTGIVTFGQELVAKRLEILKETVPKITTVLILVNRGSQGGRESAKRAEEAARKLGLKSVMGEVSAPADIEPALAAGARAGANALLPVPSTMLRANRARIAEVAIAQRLPTMLSDPIYAESGALMSYGADSREYFRAAATFVARILRGAQPADIPIERSTKFDFVVNQKTAKAIGVTIPKSVLLRADRVIE